jgi:hypothetical protein
VGLHVRLSNIEVHKKFFSGKQINNMKLIDVFFASFHCEGDKKRKGYGLDGRGVGFRFAVEAKFISSPRRPDRFWGPPCPLSNG